MVEQTPPAEQTFDRRLLLRLGLAVPAGIAAGIATLESAITAQVVVSEHTGMQVGNAGYEERLAQECPQQDPVDAMVCRDQYRNSQLFRYTVISPIFEEVCFRGVPSLATDAFEKPESKHPFRNILVGTDEGWGLNRREMVGGALSTVIFAGIHNGTARGFDTHTLPIAQAMSGGIFWWLQRKLGILCNTTAHATVNFIGRSLFRRR